MIAPAEHHRWDRFETQRCDRRIGLAEVVALGALAVLVASGLGGCSRAAPPTESSPSAAASASASEAQSEPAVPPPSEGDPSASDRPGAMDLLRRHASATGGTTTTATSRTFVMDLAIEAPDPMGMGTLRRTGTVTMWRKAPNLLRTETFVEELGTLGGGFDGTVGWATDPAGAVRLMQGASLAELRREAVFDREFHLERVYPNAELLGPVLRDGVPCWSVRLSDDDGGMAIAIFARESGLLVELGRQLPSPSGPVSVSHRFEQYEDFDDVRLPVRTIVRMGNTVQTTTLTRMDTAELDASRFAVPTAPTASDE